MPPNNINQTNSNQRVSGARSANSANQNQSSSEQLETNQNQFSSLSSQRDQMRGESSQSNGLLDYANNILSENDRAIQRMNGNTEIVQNEFNFGRGGGNGNDNEFDEFPLNNNGTDNHKKTSPFIEAAKSLLLQILGFVKVGGEPINPNIMINKYSQGSRIAEIVKSLAEAGMTDEIVNGDPMLRHEALEVDQRAAGVKGEFDTAIQYWKDVLQGNKTAEKDTHDHFKHG